MKATVIVIATALCFALVDKAHAQRALPGMQGLQITGGMVDGIYSTDNNNEYGFYFGAAMATYSKNGNKCIDDAHIGRRRIMCRSI